MSSEGKKNKVVRIPKINFKTKQDALRQSMDQSLVEDLKEVFTLLSENGKLNPHDLKRALRSVCNFIII